LSFGRGENRRPQPSSRVEAEVVHRGRQGQSTLQTRGTSPHHWPVLNRPLLAGFDRPLTHTAVRALAFKWIRILWKCWQDRKPYSEEIYEQALKCRNSRLISRLKKIEVGKSPVKKSTNHSKKSLV
jgi:hypothetical protein